MLEADETPSQEYIDELREMSVPYLDEVVRLPDVMSIYYNSDRFKEFGCTPTTMHVLSIWVAPTANELRATSITARRTSECAALTDQDITYALYTPRVVTVLGGMWRDCTVC